MNKLRYYMINMLFSAMIGAIVQCAGDVFMRQSHVDLFDLLKSIGVGAIIGTVAMFFLFHVLFKLEKHPLYGFLSVFAVVAVLSFLGDIWYGFDHLVQFIHTKWIVVLAVAEILGFILTFIWYRQILLYNRKLEQKKASNLVLEESRRISRQD